MQDIDRQIEARVRGFIAELSALVRRAALEAVESALHKRAGARPPAGQSSKSSSGRDAGSGSRSVEGSRRPTAASKRRPGEKRTQKELAKLTDRLATYIQGNKGQGIEAISRGLGVATRELTLPVKKLLAAKRISSQGHKRATRYFPR